MSTATSCSALIELEGGAKPRPSIRPSALVIIRHHPPIVDFLLARVLTALLEADIFRFCLAAISEYFHRLLASKRRFNRVGVANHLTSSLNIPADAYLYYAVRPPRIVFAVIFDGEFDAAGPTIQFSTG